MENDKIDMSAIIWYRIGWKTYILLGISVLLYWYPSPIDPKPFVFPAPLPKLVGTLARNNALQRAKRLFEGVVIGPESFAVDSNGRIFTGTSDGRIMSVNDGNVSLLARTGLDDPRCGTFEFEPACGRPKGVRVWKDGFLYVVDSYKGLLRVNTSDGVIETLVSNQQGSEGAPFKFLNSLDITREGVIYFTDSSDKWDRRNFRYAVLETDQAGRVLQYDITTGRVTTLLSGLYLANGISLSRDQTYFLVSEMSVARIRRYYIKGPLAGTSDIFIDNLPGFPDNIRSNPKGNFFVGMGSVRFEGSSPLGSFLDLIAPYPAVKRFIATITPLFMYNVFMPKHALAIEIDDKGTIVDSFHDPGAMKIGAVSELFQYNSTVYIGHYQSPYLGVIDIATFKQR